MKKEALLLIDIQDVYFTPGGPLLLNKPKEAADRAALLLEQFRKEEKLVIHIKHHFHALSGIHKSVKPIVGENDTKRTSEFIFRN